MTARPTATARARWARSSVGVGVLVASLALLWTWRLTRSPAEPLSLQDKGGEPRGTLTETAPVRPADSSTKGRGALTTDRSARLRAKHPAVSRPIAGLFGWGSIGAKSLRGAWRHGASLAFSAPGLSVDSEGLYVETGLWAYRLPWTQVTNIYCVSTNDLENPMTLAIATTDGGLIVLSDLVLDDPIAVAEEAGAARDSAWGQERSPGSASAHCRAGSSGWTGQ